MYKVSVQFGNNKPFVWEHNDYGQALRQYGDKCSEVAGHAAMIENVYTILLLDESEILYSMKIESETRSSLKIKNKKLWQL